MRCNLCQDGHCFSVPVSGNGQLSRYFGYTIANVSVSNIAGSLGTSTSQGTYVITSYAVAEAISVPLTGWLASRFGSIRVFITCFLLFGVFSLLCGLANSMSTLVMFRVLLGFVGGL